jgi:chaperone BCS1
MESVAANGLMMFFGAYAASQATSIPSKILGWARNNVLRTIQIDNYDTYYTHVETWLSANAYTRHSVISTRDGPTPVSTTKKPPKFNFFPYGVSTFRFKGKRFIAWSSTENVHGMLAKRKIITIQMLGGKRQLFEELLKEAFFFSTKRSKESVEVLVANYGSWHLADNKPFRPISTVVLADDLGNKIVGDAKKFLDQKDWYRERGVPYHRGYLFYGPPGNGKSSLGLALATELELDISFLSLSSVGNDQDLIGLVRQVKGDSIIFIEDIDAAFDKREGVTGVTMSGLLNILDGVIAQEGRIVMMTTNHIEKLDPALIRPGRIDYSVKIDNATTKQAERLLRLLAPNASNEAVEKFGQYGNGKSMAELQGEILKGEWQ